MRPDLSSAVRTLTQFSGPELTQTLARIEAAVRGVTVDAYSAFLIEAGAEREVLAAAAEMKRVAGQINVTIHALGILLCLPRILEPGETVEYVSLGAGNTGRLFDLETNLRIAEFKFIRWRGADTIRQNSTFKDFVQLAMSESPKRKYLYLLGTEHALKFLNGGRALESVLSRNVKMRKLFFERYGSNFQKVRDYYQTHGNIVAIEDVSPWLDELAEDLISEEALEGSS